MPDFFEIHVHSNNNLTNRGADIHEELQTLAAAGLRGLCLLIWHSYGLSNQEAARVFPKEFKKMALSNNDLSWYKDFCQVYPESGRLVIPFMDVRLHQDIQEVENLVNSYCIKGLKSVIVSEDSFIGVEGIAKVLDISRDQFFIYQNQAFQLASKLNLPFILHADLREEGELVWELLKNNMNVRVNIPHFGFSRKVISKFLRQFPNLFTDCSSLLEVMATDVGKYKRFFAEFSDRILWGSDTFLYNLKPVKQYHEFLMANFSQTEYQKFCCQNPITFLISI